MEENEEGFDLLDRIRHDPFNHGDGFGPLADAFWFRSVFASSGRLGASRGLPELSCIRQLWPRLLRASSLGARLLGESLDSLRMDEGLDSRILEVNRKGSMKKGLSLKRG